MFIQLGTLSELMLLPLTLYINAVSSTIETTEIVTLVSLMVQSGLFFLVWRGKVVCPLAKMWYDLILVLYFIHHHRIVMQLNRQFVDSISMRHCDSATK